jgi:hypothetical protein
MKLKELFESTGRSVADLKIDYKGGNFYCANKRLTSLEGAPSRVSGHFDCANNELASLAGAPSHVGGGFFCSDNELTSLTGAPSRVDGNFYCAFNKLRSLEGAPSHVDGYFWCSNNKLTSLKDVHKHVTEIKGEFYASDNPIKSHVLGLLLIKGVTKIQLKNKQVEEILNRHLGKGRVGMLMAQEELIEAGLEEYAKP